MGTINKKTVPAVKPPTADAGAHQNFMDGTSYDVTNPILRLRVAASSCFFGEPMFYREEGGKAPKSGRAHVPTIDPYLQERLGVFTPETWRGLTSAQLLEMAIDEALDFDPEMTLVEAARLRNEEHIRTTPQVILVRAANHPKLRDTGFIRAYGPSICKRGDEPAVCIAYQLSAFPGRPIPNGLKKTLRSILQGFDELTLAKYRMESRQVKTVDVVNLTHANSRAINKLCQGKLTTSGETWESIISKEGSTTESWLKALDVMGHMAILRNLRNFVQARVPAKLFMDKLLLTCEDAKQLPFRYYSAYLALKGLGDVPPQVLDGIESCLEKSLGNLPKFSGRTISLCDNSGSAQGATTSTLGTMRVSSIGNLTGILTGMCAEEGYLGVFGDGLEVKPVRKNSSVFDQLEAADEVAARIGQNTENGIWMFFDKAIREGERYDNIFVYSDMQAGHGGLYGLNQNQYRDYRYQGSNHIDVAALVKTYREKVNPYVNVFLVQIAGYEDTLVPEFYPRTFILGGWGEGLLRFADSMVRAFDRRNRTRKPNPAQVAVAKQIPALKKVIHKKQKPRRRAS